METRNYTIPNYYPTFVCKGPDCRANCCHGWDITLSLAEYYRLVGLDCPAELRHRLDGGLHLEDIPTSERYACFNRKWDGGCPMHRDDGWCALQKACGEDVLPSVCRYYPRSPRGWSDGVYECATSNGCELTLELLFADDAPVTFAARPLSFELKIRFADVRGVAPDKARAIRDFCIDAVSDRSVSLPQRLEKLSQTLPRALTVSTAPADLTASSIPDLSYDRFLIKIFRQHSPNLERCADAADKLLQDPEAFSEALAAFEAAYPSHEIMFEKALVNHIFYSNFPFSDLRVPLSFTPRLLLAVYSLLRSFAAAFPDTFTDAASALFRLIENSSFDYRLYREAGDGVARLSET